MMKIKNEKHLDVRYCGWLIDEPETGYFVVLVMQILFGEFDNQKNCADEHSDLQDHALLNCRIRRTRDAENHNQFQGKHLNVAVAQRQSVIRLAAGRRHGALDDVETVHVEAIALATPVRPTAGVAARSWSTRQKISVERKDDIGAENSSPSTVASIRSGRSAIGAQLRGRAVWENAERLLRRHSAWFRKAT